MKLVRGSSDRKGGAWELGRKERMDGEKKTLIKRTAERKKLFGTNGTFFEEKRA
jgi:hypothetical protein